MLRRLIKALLFLGVVGVIALAGYAFFADLSPEQSPQSVTVTLDAD